MTDYKQHLDEIRTMRKYKLNRYFRQVEEQWEAYKKCEQKLLNELKLQHISYTSWECEDYQITFSMPEKEYYVEVKGTPEGIKQLHREDEYLRKVKEPRRLDFKPKIRLH